MIGYSLWIKLAMVGAALLLVVAAAWKVYHTIDKRGYNRAVTEQLAAQAKQATENQERARFVEVQYVDREVVRTKIITKIEKELPDATKNLAACTLTDSAVGLFNDAARAVKY